MSNVFLVRQPVFDRSESAIGYELRFRDSEDGGDSFAQCFLNGSFDVVRDGLPAYVRATSARLVTGALESVDPRCLSVLLPPDIETDAEAIAGAQRLAALGIPLVMDEFRLPVPSGSARLALLNCASAVRIDLREHSPGVLKTVVPTLRRAGKRVIADHVIDAASHRSCVQLGFDAFQGPHFARPEPVPSAALPTSTATALQLMALARRENTSQNEIERVISSDPSITFQLLRIVNSAALGGRGITSITHALRMVGRNNLVRWLALASYAARTGKSGVDDELVRAAVQRAHFAERLASFGAARDKGTAFLVGLFSLLDAVFRMPLSDVLERVNLADEVKGALLDRTGPYADALQVIEAYELGLWESAADGAASLNVPPAQLPLVYAESLQAAAEHIPNRKTAPAVSTSQAREAATATRT